MSPSGISNNTPFQYHPAPTTRAPSSGSESSSRRANIEKLRERSNRSNLLNMARSEFGRSTNGSNEPPTSPSQHQTQGSRTPPPLGHPAPQQDDEPKVIAGPPPTGGHYASPPPSQKEKDTVAPPPAAAAAATLAPPPLGGHYVSVTHSMVRTTNEAATTVPTSDMVTSGVSSELQTSRPVALEEVKAPPITRMVPPPRSPDGKTAKTPIAFHPPIGSPVDKPPMSPARNKTTSQIPKTMPMATVKQEISETTHPTDQDTTAPPSFTSKSVTEQAKQYSADNVNHIASSNATDIRRLRQQLDDATLEKKQLEEQNAIMAHNQQASLAERQKEERLRVLSLLLHLSIRKIRKALLRHAMERMKLRLVTTPAVKNDTLNNFNSSLSPHVHNMNSPLTRSLSVGGLVSSNQSLLTPFSSQPEARVMSPPRPIIKTSLLSTGEDSSWESLGIEKVYMVTAAKLVPHEYSSPLATYSIRPPFLSTNGSNNVLPASEYEKNASPTTPQTVEVVARIIADDSVFILWDYGMVMHVPAVGRSTGGRREFDIRNLTEELNTVEFINGIGVETEYSLHTIYEEANMTRHAYCSSLITAANALQAAKSVVSPAPAMNGNAPLRGNGATDSPEMKVTQKGMGEVKPRSPPTAPASPDPTVEQTPPVVKGPTSSPQSSADDIFLDYLFWMISLFFRSVFYVIVKVPFKLFVASLKLFILVAIVILVWLFLADDHGAMDMGATGRIDAVSQVF